MSKYNGSKSQLTLVNGEVLTFNCGAVMDDLAVILTSLMEETQTLQTTYTLLARKIGKEGCNDIY